MEAEGPPKKQNLGTTALFGGILQVLFGFSLSIVPLAIFIVTIWAAVSSLIKKEERNQKMFAVISLCLVIIMAILYFIFGIVGIIGSFISGYLPS